MKKDFETAFAIDNPDLVFLFS